MSPEKVYTAFYAYYATRGGVCTLRRGARAARGCAGRRVCVARSSPVCAVAWRVWCGGDKDRLTSQSTRRPVTTAHTARVNSPSYVMWASPAEPVLWSSPEATAAQNPTASRVSIAVLVHLTMSHLHAAQLAGTAGHPCACAVCGTWVLILESCSRVPACPVRRVQKHVLGGRHTSSYRTAARTRGRAIYGKQARVPNMAAG